MMMSAAEPRLRAWDRVGRLRAEYHERFVTTGAYRAPAERAWDLDDLRRRAGDLLLQRVHDLRIGSLPRATDDGVQEIGALAVAVGSGSGSRAGGSPQNAFQNARQGVAKDGGGFGQVVRRRLARAAFNRRQAGAQSTRQRQRRSQKYKQFQQRVPLHQPYQGQYSQRYPEQYQKPHRVQHQKHHSPFFIRPPAPPVRSAWPSAK